MSAQLPSGTSIVATDRQLSTTFGDEVIILGLDDNMYFGLSDTGARVWQLVQSPRTAGEIVETIVGEYEVDRQRAQADLEALLGDLLSRGLIAIAQPPLDR